MASKRSRAAGILGLSPAEQVKEQAAYILGKSSDDDAAHGAAGGAALDQTQYNAFWGSLSDAAGATMYMLSLLSRINELLVGVFVCEEIHAWVSLTLSLSLWLCVCECVCECVCVCVCVVGVCFCT